MLPVETDTSRKSDMPLCAADFSPMIQHNCRGNDSGYTPPPILSFSVDFLMCKEDAF